MISSRYVFSLLLSLLALACASSLHYASDYPLSTKYFRSRDNIFSGHIPQGWFLSTDDSLAPNLATWLLRDDIAATMTIREIIPDKLTAQQIKKGGVELLALIVIGMHNHASSTAAPKSFMLSGKKFCGYEIMDDSVYIRVVVFEAKGKYFACEAKPLKGKWSAEAIALLFTTQQTVLSTLVF